MRSSVPPVLLLAFAMACAAGQKTVDIHATNYGFKAPATVAPGMTKFRFINDGSVLHEVQLFRFKTGITPEDAAVFLKGASIPDSAYDISGGVLITEAATTSHEMLLLPLAHGEVYGLQCEFRDADSLPKHSTMGMWAVMRVE
jgi:hypothetical protein